MNKNFYVCAFCLEVYESEVAPSRCDACKVVRCMKCQTWIKDRGPLFCYGCGLINPVVEAKFVATYQTAIHFLYDDWHCRNSGRGVGGEFCISRVKDVCTQNLVPMLSRRAGAYAGSVLKSEAIDIRVLEPWETDYLYPKEDCENGEQIQEGATA